MQLDAICMRESSVMFEAVMRIIHRWQIPFSCTPPNFWSCCSVFQAELAEHIPVIKTSVAGTRLIGRMTVGLSPTDFFHVESSHFCCLRESQTSLVCKAPLWNVRWIVQETRTACYFQALLQIKVRISDQSTKKEQLASSQ